MTFIQRLREHPVFRYISFFLMLVVALVAAAIVASLTIDLGPAVRAKAEVEGSKYIERPMHIGSLKIHLLTGKVLVENLTIDGFTVGDRPFFTAKEIAVSLDWIGAIARKPDITISSVEMTDWNMLVEKWAGGHNFPRFNHDDGKPPGPKRVTTTLKALRAYRGQFAYEDHETPWTVVCPNLDISIGNVPNYHGTAAFHGGTVTIQDFVPMWANFEAQFVIDGPRIHLDRIDLESDGAKTVLRGDVDMGHWPNMGYTMRSRVNFPRMRELFFKDAAWRVSGDGDFNGTFRLWKEQDVTNRDLTGTFSSDLAGLNAYRFPSLYGSLRWTQHGFDIWDAGSAFYGGTAQFVYSIKPFGQRVPATHRFDSTLTDLDLARFTDFEQLPGQRFAGSASMRNHLEWPSGHFDEHRGGGHVLVNPPPGVTTMTSSLAPRAADAEHARNEWGPLAPQPLPAHLPIAGELTYEYSPDDVTIEQGRFATERTFVTFNGRTAYGDRSRLPFHVTSSDWQESDQLLAGIISDFGSPTGPVAFGGRGEFDGVMTGAFRRPRVEGVFSGEDMRAWDTLWGAGSARIVVENRYVNISESLVRRGDSEIRADGLFSLGYPRDDAGEEMNARIRVARRDVDSLRHAFGIDEYPVSGLLSGEFHLTGAYERPVGFGAMTIDDGTAYGEPFQKATSSLRFDGSGVRLDSLVMAKGTGTLNGAAFVGWDSTYAFNATGRRIPVEHFAFLSFPRAPLSGVADITAEGRGTFDAPRNDFRLLVNDLVVAEEALGQVSGTLALRGNDLTGQLDGVSPRLGVLNASGRISMTREADAELQFRFHDTSLDPFLKLFAPKLSPMGSATVSGAVRIVGELANFQHLRVDATVDAVDMTLLDYPLKNGSPVRIALEQQQVRIDNLLLVDADTTKLRIAGGIDLNTQRMALSASGDANLGIVQMLSRDVRAAGRAALTASIEGPLAQPQVSGSATITDGRIRHFSMPNSLDAINGTIHFDPGGIRLDDLSATMGGGRVQFGGRIGLDGYEVGDLDITARAEEMHLRVPEGVRSVVDADLSLRGPHKSPTLGGTVTVRNALWSRRIETPGSIVDLFPRRSSDVPAPSGGSESAFPVKFDLHLLVPSTLRVENNLLRIVANADLALRGTYDRPVMIGHADIERGEIVYQGLRYRLTRGAMDFTNPSRIEPFFDVEAEANVRVPGQTYRITVGVAGTGDSLRPTFNADPYLPTADILALLFSDVRRGGTQDVAPELRALQNPNQAQADIVLSRGGQAITEPITAPVQKVVEQNFGIDSFQLTALPFDPTNLTQSARLNPTARVTIGKRISNRAYLTFSRTLNTTYNDQIVLLEVEENDRVSWILSRNEDLQTYALEFRVRHVF